MGCSESTESSSDQGNGGRGGAVRDAPAPPAAPAPATAAAFMTHHFGRDVANRLRAAGVRTFADIVLLSEDPGRVSGSVELSPFIHHKLASAEFRREAASEANAEARVNATRRVEAALDQLRKMRDAGLITAAEHDYRRAEELRALGVTNVVVATEAVACAPAY